MSPNPQVATEAVVHDLRDQVEQLTTKLSSVTADHEAAMQVVEQRNGALSRAVHERDRIKERVELLEQTHKLWAQTSGFLPVVGLTCDGDGCRSAIGVVGVKLANVDCIVHPALAIAECAGWTTKQADGKSTHYCPSCSK